LRNSQESCLRQCRRRGDAHADARQRWQLWPGFATVLVALAAAVPTRAADLEFVETKELRIVYFDPNENHLVPHATQGFLNGLATHERLFDYVPDGRISVLLQDFSDRANATAIPAPRNRIFLDIAPSNEPYETVSAAEWFAWTAVHELTHIVDNDRASPADARFRHLFHGKVDVDSAHPETLLYNYLTTPRLTAPRWYQEGSAVFMETWMSGGVGRAQGGYDEMVFRAMVQEDARFYDPLGLVSKGTEIDFKTGANAYLYGTRFMDYLGLHYGPQKLLAWWRRDADSRRYYAHDFQRVFGLPLDESWRQWIDWEHSFQRQNLLAVREHPVTEYRDLTKKDLGAVSRTYLSADGTKLFAAVKYPGQLAHIASIGRSDGRVTEIKEVKGASGYTVTSLAYDAASETLFYTTNNNTHRNLEALELRSGKSRMLLKAARIGDIVYNPTDRSLWGLRLNNGFVILVRIPFPYKEWQTLYVFPRGERAFDLDLSPDGSLASVSVSGPGLRPGSPQVTQVRVLRTDALAKGDATPLHIFTMGAAVPEGFVFSKDGRYLYGSSYFTGVSNIYRYELATETLAAVSNADVGFFRPLPLDESQLIVLRYGARGFVPTLIEARPTEDLSAVTFLGEQVAAKYPEVQGWVAPAPSTIPYESQILRKGAYRPMRELSLESLIPVVEGYKNSVGLGASARFSDPLGYDAFGLDTSYSPDNRLPVKQRLHVTAGVHHTRWTAGAAWNSADFYDLFGPTKRSLAGYNGYLGYDLPLVFDPPQAMDFVAKVAYYGGLDTLPGYQNVTSPSKNLFTADAGFVATDTRASPGAVDVEAGHSWTINAHANGAAGDLIPSLTGTFDVGFPLPLNHSSIWLRSGASLSTGARANPLANSYLGGFGNNYVDSGGNGGVQRYRELLSMPGFRLDALNGKSLVKSTLEWCLPPLRFEALGSPGFYASWVRPEAFVSALETDPDKRAVRRSAHDVGAQLDLQLHVMHRQSMMLSVGAARGFGAGGLGRSEFMLSLQVL
jgi:hypothetical protein